MPGRPLPNASSAATSDNALALRLAMLGGGDQRLAIDPRTGRNRYGISSGDVDDEVSFASSTASPMTRRGRAAAMTAFVQVLSGRSREDWTRSIRERLFGSFGLPGSEVILTGSGTEAELVLLTLARELLGPAMTNIVLAPDETGSGVTLAAGGRHFLDSASCAPSVAKGAPLEGLDSSGIIVEGVAIREKDGRLLAADRVDAEVADRVSRAVRSGRAAVVHCLDTSKTGQPGLGRAAARSLAIRHPGQVLVVVDACQLRCSAEEVRQDLAAGFFVMITGSKFVGGPPFAGAVLVPPSAAGRLRRIRIPTGMAAYSAETDWPATLRDRVVGRPFTTAVNTGLGLRWEAALAEWDALAAHAPAVLRAVTAHLGSIVREAVTGVAGLRLLDDGAARSDRLQTIFPVITATPTGDVLCAKSLHQGLMRAAPSGSGADGSGRIFHVGQAVPVGRATALRICIGAPHIADVADRLVTGAAMDAASRPFTADLAALLTKWTRLRADAAPVRRRA